MKHRCEVRGRDEDSSSIYIYLYLPIERRVSSVRIVREPGAGRDLDGVDEARHVGQGRRNPGPRVDVVVVHPVPAIVTEFELVDFVPFDRARTVRRLPR